MADETRWNEIATRWWRELQPDDKRPNPSTKAGDRASVARLRRCATVAQAATIPAALDLARRLDITHGRHGRLDSVLLAAIVLAHVRADDRSVPVARQLGGAGPDARAPMSPLRFARLLNAETVEEKLIAFRRAVALLGGTAHVPNLAFALLDWSDKTRIDWAFEYHGAPRPGAEAANPAQPAAGDAA
jgi:CRISPR system Cascade subunit CasB